MQNRLFLIPIAIAGVILAIYITLQGLSYGFGSIMSMGALVIILVPVIIMVANELYASWCVFLFLAVTLNLNMNVALFDRFTTSVWAALLIIAMMLARKSMLRKNLGDAFTDIESRLFLFVFLIVLMRILTAPPSSARLGGTGGIAEALYYFLCGPIFWAVTAYVLDNFDVARTFKRATLLLTLAATGVLLYKTFQYATTGVFGAAFQVSMWLPASFLFVWIYQRQALGSRLWRWSFIKYVLILLILFAALMSGARVYLPMAFLMVALVAYAYFEFRRVVGFIFLLVVPLSVLLMIYKPEVVPRAAFRSVSVLMPDTAKRLQLEYAPGMAMGEFGWKENEFRKTMYQRAWQSIRGQPFAGKGFAFSFTDIVMSIAAIDVAGDVAGGVSQALTVSGGFHNSILSLAYFCGIPAALFALLATLLVFWRLLKQVRWLQNADNKAMCTALLCGLVAFLMSALTQGSGLEWLSCCILLGVAHGMYRKMLREAPQT